MNCKLEIRVNEETHATINCDSASSALELVATLAATIRASTANCLDIIAFIGDNTAIYATHDFDLSEAPATGMNICACNADYFTENAAMNWTDNIRENESIMEFADRAGKN